MTEPTTLSSSSLMTEASKRAGMSDWGDLAFRDHLDLLLDSCRRTAALNLTGWRALRKNALRCLVNRLYLQAYVKAHPGVTDHPIHSPIAITGLPRTGTSLLQSLMALDPSNRVLRFWQALRPVPPDPSNDLSEAALIAEAESWIEKLYAAAPRFRAVHASTAHGPQECDVLLQNEFASWHFEVAFPAEDYSSWLTYASLRREYGYYALQLRVLSYAGDPALRWVLKSPSHLGQLDALFASCPGTVIVHCHRHPLEAIPSFASLVLTVRSPYSDSVSTGAIGKQALRRFSVAMSKALQVRDAVGSGRFIDVAYARLARDPVGVVKEIYQRLGRQLGAGFEERMRRWLAAHPQHQHGAHRYSLEQFGLGIDEVTAGFARYCEEFAYAIAR